MLTMEQLLKKAYGEGSKYVQKSDDPVLSSTTGVYNSNYGKYAYSQLNQMDTAFGLMNKEAFNKSGFRVKTVRGQSITSIVGGLAETDTTLPDAKKPTWVPVSHKPKQYVTKFKVSDKEEYFANGSNDDAAIDMASMRIDQALEHKEVIDAMLLTDVTTLAGNNFESIDRVASSYSEVTAGLCDAGDSDIYGIDRDAAASWADAYVSHASGTDRYFDDDLMRALLANTAVNGAKTNILLTGFDTAADIQGEYQNQARYNNVGSDRYKATINGVETAAGTEVGTTVATIYKVPLFVNNKVAKDTKSRIYALDTTNQEGQGSRLHFAVARPTMYMESGDFIANGSLDYLGAYYTMGETRCTYFAAQGKMRDLK